MSFHFYFQQIWQIIRHQDGPRLGLAGMSLGRPWGLLSRYRPSWIRPEETAYTRKEGAKRSVLRHHTIPRYSPTSVSTTSRMYRVTISWATATTPTTDYDQHFYTTTSASNEETIPIGSLEHYISIILTVLHSELFVLMTLNDVLFCVNIEYA